MVARILDLQGLTVHLSFESLSLIFLILLETGQSKNLVWLELKAIHNTIPLYMQHLLSESLVEQLKVLFFR